MSTIISAITPNNVYGVETTYRNRSPFADLSLSELAAVVHFPDVLQHFRAEHPDVHLHLTVEPSAALVARLGRGELDLVVCAQPPEIPVGVETEPLMVEVLAVHGPDGATLADPATWGPWVLFPSGSHTRREIAEVLGRLGARVDVVADSHQPEVLREMVRLGVGWIGAPPWSG